MTRYHEVHSRSALPGKTLAVGTLLLAVVACASSAHAPVLVTPACETPARLRGDYDLSAPTLFTVLANPAIAAAVADEYGLPKVQPDQSTLSVPAHIDQQLLARLRCDRRVPALEFSRTLRNVVQ
jgi:hypothetical protein